MNLTKSSNPSLTPETSTAILFPERKNLRIKMQLKKDGAVESAGAAHRVAS